MNRLFNPDSPLMQFLTRMADLVILNIMWLIFCLPIFTIGASTTALYRSLLTLLDGGASSTVKLFWGAFRSNFKKATLLFLILLLPFAAVVVELILALYSTTISNFLRVICTLAPFLFGLAVGYVYPLQAQFENTLLGTLKNAVILAIANFPTSLLVLLLSLLPLITFYFATSFFFRTAILWIIIGAALIAYCNTVLLRRVFRKFFPADDQQLRADS